MELCEWNPVLQEPAENPRRPTDCPNMAELSVGAEGQWHLCRRCAGLPVFRRFRIRKTIYSRPVDPR